MPEIPSSASWGNGRALTPPQEPGCPQALRSRVPHGTPQFSQLTRLTRFLRPASLLPRQCRATLQDHGGCVVVAIQDEPTAWTDMRAHAERLVDTLSARSPIGQDAAAVLGGVLRWHRHHWDLVQPTVVLHPPAQTGPAHIRDGFRQAP